MAVAHVQTLSAADTDLGTTATGPSITTTAGNLLIATLFGFDPGSGNPTCSASSWNSTAGTQAITRQNGTTDSRVYVFYWMNIGGATSAPTFTVSASSRWIVIVTEVSGAATASALDGAGASATGSGTSAASGNFTGSVSDGFVYGAFGSEIATGTITSAGWTIPANGTLQSSGGANLEAGVEYKANPGSAGPHNTDFAISSSAWAAAVVIFKAASGGGGTTRGIPLGGDGTAFNGGRCITGLLRAPYALKAA